MTESLDALQAEWEGRWEEALAAWSRFVKLRPPRLCRTVAEEKAEELSGSFAMIRLVDHTVVISLRQVREKGLERFATEILAHEIGHHVLAPADLQDNARLFAHIRMGLPGVERYAGLVANLYTDLLVNDRLQREAGLDIAGVYRALRQGPADPLWTLVLRIAERLWNLPRGDLVEGEDGERLRSDADLGSRVIRTYARDWLRGASRFAALLLPYVEEYAKSDPSPGFAGGWLDTLGAGHGEEIPDGLSEMDESEQEGAIHPYYDEALTGIPMEREPEAVDPSAGGARETRGGRKNEYRSPAGYVDLMKSVGVKISEKEMVCRYYKERAIPFLVPFPTREVRQSTDPLPEGLDPWDPGSPIDDVDWFESVLVSPVVIPGATTVQRRFGTTEGTSPEREPVDLYLGVDCSGSMTNPAYGLSWPVLAGTVLTLSALRAGAKVMVTLSGEPGEYTSTDGFTRDEREILTVLTGYLGTGYAFGVERLERTFLQGEKRDRPVHILLVSDTDWFLMLDSYKNGWEIAEKAAIAAGGGATAALEMRWGVSPKVAALERTGWTVHGVRDMESLVEFARAFSRAKYGREP